MLVSAVISWIVVRRRCRGAGCSTIWRRCRCIPGLVLGLAIMICYLYFDIGVYGTLWIM